ncbi:MAG TPA: AmmeMemoRadiSam system protein B [Candidatus Paceibacterota bacterium]|nr:AmmeMemoRadiSam system protein B [Candidatus Paceibacterota bacterium]
MRRIAALLLAVPVLLPFGTHASAPAVRGTPFTNDAWVMDRAASRIGVIATTVFSRVHGGVVTHHIPNGAPLIAEFYARLATSQNVTTFVILAPDHFERGRAAVTVSRSAFATPFATLQPDAEFIAGLEASGLVTYDEGPFDDHSIHSQVLGIARYFPKAEIVPVLIRSKTRNDDAVALGRLIASLSGPGTFVVGSVDFSHYLGAERAFPLDEHSARTLALMRPDLAGVAEADSPQSLTALMTAVTAMGARSAQTVGVYNSDRYSGGLRTVTTGYVLQYYGSGSRLVSR